MFFLEKGSWISKQDMMKIQFLQENKLLRIFYLYEMNAQKKNPGTHMNENETHPQTGSFSKHSYS